jgi:hypothetical protein
MSNNKQISSVDWLIKQKEKYGMIIMDDLIKAKAMHKEEIENAWNSFDGKTFEQYYNETYGNNTP